MQLERTEVAGEYLRAVPCDRKAAGLEESLDEGADEMTRKADADGAC